MALKKNCGQNKYSDWLLRRDGRAFPRLCNYPYTDTEDEILFFELTGEPLFYVTKSNETKQMISDLALAINAAVSDREKKISFAKRFLLRNNIQPKYVAPDHIPTLCADILQAFRKEFVAVNLHRYSDKRFEICPDLLFLVFYPSFDWMPVIRGFVGTTNAKTVTVQSDKKATGSDDFLTDEKRRQLKQLPVKEFEKHGCEN